MPTRFISLHSLAVGIALAAVTTLATTSVVVEPGDTLTQLAADHDVTVAELIDWNDLDDPDLILAGTTLVFSSPSSHGDPAAGVSGGGDHTVVAGDTLWLIARRYGASVSALAQANGLSDPDRIHVGQRLVVTDASSSEAVDSPEPSGSRTGPTDDVGSGSEMNVSTHTVAVGETLYFIARLHDLEPSELAAANSIQNHDLIRIGQEILIPSRGNATTVAEAQPSSPITTDPDADSSPADAVASQEATDDSVRSPNATLLTDAFAHWSANYGVSQDLLEALLWQESSWQPSITGPDGHLGIGQLSPDTVTFIEDRLLGLSLNPLGVSDGVQLAARYLRYLIDSTQTDKEALGAWNQGLNSLLDEGISESGAAFADSVLEIRRIRG